MKVRRERGKLNVHTYVGRYTSFYFMNKKTVRFETGTHFEYFLYLIAQKSFWTCGILLG